MQKERIISIDILKCLAAILITNSHMGALYPHFQQLATGGAIGDALFFFCSGFTLFLSRKRSFVNYYKRRIGRIYPSVFAWAIIASFILGYNNDMRYTIMYGGRWFVACIMIYYIPLYFVHRYFMKYICHIVIVVFVLAYLCLILYDNIGPHNIYGSGICRYFFLFIYMLLGAYMGTKAYKDNVSNKYWCLQIVSLIPLYGIVLCLYRICNSEVLKKIYNSKAFGFVIRLIGGCCLEIYLVQYSLFTTDINFLFPANIIIIFICIVLAAYLVRCLARIFSQTFQDMDYDWKSIIKV